MKNSFSRLPINVTIISPLGSVCPPGYVKASIPTAGYNPRLIRVRQTLTPGTNHNNPTHQHTMLSHYHSSFGHGHYIGAMSGDPLLGVAYYTENSNDGGDPYSAMWGHTHYDNSPAFNYGVATGFVFAINNYTSGDSGWGSGISSPNLAAAYSPWIDMVYCTKVV